MQADLEGQKAALSQEYDELKDGVSIQMLHSVSKIYLSVHLIGNIFVINQGLTMNYLL